MYGNVLFRRTSAAYVFCCCAIYRETLPVSRGWNISHAILIEKRVIRLANYSICYGICAACVLLLRR